MTDTLQQPVDDTLDDLVGNPDDTLADLVGQSNSTPPAINKPSSLNYAATVTALTTSPEYLIENYRKIDSELQLTGRSPLAESLLESATNAEKSAMQPHVVGTLSDPTVDDATKVRLANDYMNNFKINIQDHLVTQSLIEGSEGENDEQEIVRTEMAKYVKDYNEYRVFQQDLLNRETLAATADSSTIGDYLEIFETLLPGQRGEQVAQMKDRLKGGDGNALNELSTFLWSGHDISDIKKQIDSVPIDQRKPLLERLASVASFHGGILSGGENNFAKISLLQELVDDQSYLDSDKWFDTVTGWLDIVGLGGATRELAQTAKAIKVGKELTGVIRGGDTQGMIATLSDKGNAKAFSRVSKGDMLALKDVTVVRSLKGGPQPLSYLAGISDANPAKGKAALNIISNDDTGEAAQALAGGNRTDVIADAFTPEVATEGGSVASKLSLTHIDDFVNKQTYAGATEGEVERFKTEQLGKLQNIPSLTARVSMFSVDNTEKGLVVRGVYGNGDVGWGTAGQARQAAINALRGYGVQPEDINLLQRSQTIYNPAARDLPDEAQGDFLVSIDFDRAYRNPEQLDPLDIINNFGDVNGWKMSKEGGTFSAYLNTYKSMLPAFITKAAGAVVDRAAKLNKLMLKDFEAFTKPLITLPKDRQDKIMNFLKESNYNRTWSTTSEMQRKGFTPTEIVALENFRAIQDMAWRLENRDLVHSSRSQGYRLFVDNQSNSEYLVQPYKKNFWVGKGTQEVYDSTTNSFIRMTDQEIDQVYNVGGSIDKLIVNEKHSSGKPIEFVVNRNNASVFNRELLDNDKLLTYIPGHYTVMYEQEYFLFAKNKDDIKILGTANSLKDAKEFKAKLSAQGGSEVFISPDMKKVGDVPPNWRVNVARGTGRLSQKHRGQQLTTIENGMVSSSQAHMAGPVESVLRQLESLSNRVATREFMDNYLDRIMRQYDDVITSRDQFGNAVVPNGFNEIGFSRHAGKDFDKKRIGDAKTAFGYYWFMRDGYVNLMDDAYKNLMNNVADSFGKADLAKLEVFARNRAKGMGPTEAVRATVFNTMIAMNPIRQLPLQAMQSLQNLPILFAEVGVKNFHKASKDVGVMTSYILAKQMGVDVGDAAIKMLSTRMTKADLEHMYKSFQESGLVASIDRHNICVASMNQLADESSLSKSKVGRAMQSPLHFARKFGFDAGENVVISSSYATHYAVAMLKGKNMRSAKDLLEVAGDARSYSGSMNRAGDVPYNRNSLSIILQFQQVPHKLFLQMLPSKIGGDRTVTPKQKAALFAFNSAMFGIPAGIGYALLDPFFEDDVEGKRSQDRASKGLMSLALNHLLSAAMYDHEFNEYAGIDFSSLAPWDLHGFFTIAHSGWSEGPATMLTQIPAAQVAGRLSDATRVTLGYLMEDTMANRFFNFDGPKNVDRYNLPMVLKSMATLASSGYSNYRKAAVANESEILMSSTGMTLDQQRSIAKDIAQAMGFPSEESANRWDVSSEVYSKTKEFEEDVKADFKNFLKDITLAGNRDEKAKILESWEYTWSLYKGPARTRAIEILGKERRKMVEVGDMRLFDSLVKNSDVMTKDEFNTLMSKVPESPNENLNKMRMEVIDDVNSLEGMFKED